MGHDSRLKRAIPQDMVIPSVEEPGGGEGKDSEEGTHGRAESRERDVLACLRFSVHGVVKSHPGGPMWEQCALRAPGSPWADESR